MALRARAHTIANLDNLLGNENKEILCFYQNIYIVTFLTGLYHTKYYGCWGTDEKYRGEEGVKLHSKRSKGLKTLVFSF